MSDTSPFVDRVWVLTAIDGEPIEQVTDRAPDVQFGGDGRLSGFAGVNRLMGSWQVDDGMLTLQGPATTMMAGPPPAMALEQQFLRALGTGGTLHHHRDSLTIGERLAFVAAPTGANELALLEGSVAYRERIAMPPNATLIVQLLDVSRQDVAADVLAESVVDAPGNVPVPFTLSYDPSVVDARRSYAVSARIIVDGDLWWISAERHTVFAGDDSGPVSIRLQRVDRAPDGG